MKISSSLSLKFRCRIEFLSVSNRHYMYFIKPLPHTDFSHVRVRKFKFCFLYNSPIFCFLFSSESYNGELNVVNMEICANFPVLGTLTYLNETCTVALTLWRRNYFFFLILAHTVYKMWIIQEPKKLELWNKLHFEEEKTESIGHV